MVTHVLRLRDVMKRTGLGRSSICAKRDMGTFPRAIRIVSRAVAWGSGVALAIGKGGSHTQFGEFENALGYASICNEIKFSEIGTAGAAHQKFLQFSNFLLNDFLVSSYRVLVLKLAAGF